MAAIVVVGRGGGGRRGEGAGLEGEAGVVEGFSQEPFEVLGADGVQTAGMVVDLDIEAGFGFEGEEGGDGRAELFADGG